MKEMFGKKFTEEKIEVKKWDVRYIIKESFIRIVKLHKKGYQNVEKSECTLLQGKLETLYMLHILTWDEYLKYLNLLILWMKKNNIH